MVQIRRYYSRAQMEDRAVQMAIAWWPIEEVIALHEMHDEEEMGYRQLLRTAEAPNRERLERRYDPNQPRVPAGDPTGGQWLGNNHRVTGSAKPRVAKPHVTGKKPDGPTPPGGPQVTSTQRNALSQVVARDIAMPDGSQIHAAFNPDGTRGFTSRYTVTNPDGQSFVFTNNAGRQRISDAATGQVVADTVAGPNGLRTVVATAQAAVLGGAAIGTSEMPPAALALGAAAAGITLYNYLSSLPGGNPPAAFLRARAYDIGRDDEGNPTLDVTRVAALTKAQTEAYCPRYSEVQAYTDQAYAAVAAANPTLANPATFGTYVHTALKGIIDGLHDPNLVAEQSFTKANDNGRADYGDSGSVRIDAYEKTPNQSVCVYDIKTGTSGLSFARMAEIADNAHKAFGTYRNLVVVEMRPTR